MNWFGFLTRSVKGCFDSFDGFLKAMMHASERQQLQFGMLQLPHYWVAMSCECSPLAVWELDGTLMHGLEYTTK
jgi:hypothetical protein